jgi:molybdate transport system substrate-binding protein
MIRSKAMKNTATITLCFALVAGLLAPTVVSAAPAKRTVEVFAAASLSDAFTEIAHELEKQQPGLTVLLNFAGSQQLAAQIESGALPDVFASADDRWMSYVRDLKLIAGEPATFTTNRLVVIVPKTNPARIGRLQDLSRGGVKLVIGADAVPVGRYSRVVLRNLARDPAFDADFARLTLRNVVSEEENVKSIVSKVQLGEADAGMVYFSDVTPTVVRYVRLFGIPDSANVVASYPIARVEGGRDSTDAKAFIDLVLSPAGQEILKHNNFTPVPVAKP